MPGERILDTEGRVQQARDVAWSALNRRERTVTEMHRLLERKGVDVESAGTVIDELIGGGWLDDAAYARRFAEDRRNLDGWGSERIGRRLRQLGIRQEHVEAAVADRDAEEELDAAVEYLARRFPVPPATVRDAARALGILVRKGYDLELAHDALRRHAGVGEFEDSDSRVDAA
jgi:regulatory protein